jgi:hypothetical protein
MTIGFSYRKGESFGGGHPFVQTLAKYLRRNSGPSLPTLERVPHSQVLDIHSPSCVVRLVFLRGPAAILLAVWAIVIYPFERVRGRGLLSHVVEKDLERHLPFRANPYPSAPVVVELRRFRVEHPPLHGSPRAVLGGLRRAVRGICRGAGLSVAPARHHLSGVDNGGADCGLVATVTGALPELGFWAVPKYLQPTSALTYSS